VYCTIGRGNTAEATLRDRIEKLDSIVCRLMLENEFLKRGLKNSISQPGRNRKLSPGISISSAVSPEDAG